MKQALRKALTGTFAIIPLFFLFPDTTQANGNVYVSRFWHIHQPIYWPEWNGNGSQTERVQYAWDSIVLKPGQVYDSGVAHPENDLSAIFGVDDRKAAYQGRARDSLSAIDGAGGFAMSYSGSLISDVRNLANAGQLGYGSGWWDGNRTASGWTTPSGSRRLDLVGFTYHHSLGALIPKEVFRKELQVFKQAWWKAWDKNSDLSDHSKGYFPTEMGFSRHMVDVLVDEGYEWSIVASHHLSRTCPTYFDQFNLTNNTYGIFSSPPNRADQQGPSPGAGWWYGVGNVGETAWNVSPFAYQLHRVKYVNPETGAEKGMLVVPSDDILSYRFGYSDDGIGKIQTYISPFATDPNRPVLALPSTDGDNAWGGGYDSWMVATPKLFSDSQNAGYRVTAIQDFVNQHGAAAPYTHIEDGAWIFPESDYGSPYFLKWLEPPLNPDHLELCYPGTKVDLETPGFALKFWSWAPVIAGANWCETAEQMWTDGGGDVAAWKIQAPYDWDGTYTMPNIVERAWHIYLAGLDSGFNYYGGLGNDDEVKQSLATRRAIEMLNSYVTGNLAEDRTPPTVFKPQRFPWNPGTYTFGWFNATPTDGNALKLMPSEFYIWTHAYDVSGITGVNLKIRIDNDGYNAAGNNQNETYAGGPDVGPWVTIPMTRRVLPNDTAALNAAADNGQINYFSQALSPHIADYYFAKITDASLPGFRDKLLDYYIEATDSRGNTHKSDIQQVFAEDDGQGSSVVPSSVTFSDDPRDCAPLSIVYAANDGVLSNSVPVTMQISFDQGTNWTPYVMSHQGGGTSTYTVATVPDDAPGAIVWFEDDTATIIDSRNGANWATDLRNCDAPVGPSAVSIDPPEPDGCGDITISYHPNGEGLQEGPIYIHIGRNGFQDVIIPNPVMAPVSNHWEYVYSPIQGTYAIDMAFNNGVVWDNNDSLDWHFAVTNCEPLVIPPGIVITNPAMESITVSNSVATYTLRGTAGEGTGDTLAWSNSLTGAEGYAPSAPSWIIHLVPLLEGTNIIFVSSSNTVSGTAVLAADDAGDPAYDPSWDDGDDGGTGWGGGWTLGSDTNAGHFRATAAVNTNLDMSGDAWGLWAENQNLSDASRPLASALASGQTLRVKFENNNIQENGSVGISLKNGDGEILFEFYFVGGESFYRINDNTNGRSTGIPWSDAGWDLSFERTGVSHYEFKAGTNVISGQVAEDADRAVSRFRVFNYNAGGGDAYNVYLNNLEITGPLLSSSTTGDMVGIVREAAVLQDGIPVSWWQRYGLGPTNTAGGNSDTDPASNGDEYAADTDPTDTNSFYRDRIQEVTGQGTFIVMSGTPTTNSRVYDLWICTSLVEGVWTPQGLDVPGAPDGSAVPLVVTNVMDRLFYQSGVRVP